MLLLRGSPRLSTLPLGSWASFGCRPAGLHHRQGGLRRCHLLLLGRLSVLLRERLALA